MSYGICGIWQIKDYSYVRSVRQQLDNNVKLVCRLKEFLIYKLLLSVTVFNLLATLFSCKFAVNQKTCILFLGDNITLIKLNSKVLCSVLSLRETFIYQTKYIFSMLNFTFWFLWLSAFNNVNATNQKQCGISEIVILFLSNVTDFMQHQSVLLLIQWYISTYPYWYIFNNLSLKSGHG